MNRACPGPQAGRSQGSRNIWRKATSRPKAATAPGGPRAGPRRLGSSLGPGLRWRLGWATWLRKARRWQRPTRLRSRSSGACRRRLTWRREGAEGRGLDPVFLLGWRGGGCGCGSDSPGAGSANRRWISPIPFKRVARASAAKHFRVHRRASASVPPTANRRRLGSRASVPGGCPGQTERAARLAGPGWDPRAEVSAGPAPAPATASFLSPHDSLPPLRARAAAETWDAGLPGPGRRLASRETARLPRPETPFVLVCTAALHKTKRIYFIFAHLYLQKTKGRGVKKAGISQIPFSTDSLTYLLPLCKDSISRNTNISQMLKLPVLSSI